MSKADSQPATSPSLLLRIRDSSDGDSWREFESIYAPVIRRYCRRRGFHPTDIDDIAQEVMIAVAQGIRKFEYQPEKGKFRGWLATVTANKLRTFISKRKQQDQVRLVEVVNQLAEAPESDSHWSEVFLQQVLKIAVERIIAGVEETTWRCFELTWMNNKPAAGVAEELKLPIHTVYVNKSRVLKRLEREFVILTDDYPLMDKPLSDYSLTNKEK